jgi:hypothetical protein
MIIGICGFIGSGKDSIADHLVKNHLFTRLSFASVLKDACADIFSWDREMLEGKTEAARVQRESKDEWWSDKLGMDISPRYALQFIGTDVFRNNLNPNIWVYAVERRLKLSTNNYVISDVRFPNEIKMITDNGGEIWRVERGENPKWVPDAEKYLTSMEYCSAQLMMKDKYPSVHESEWAWVGSEFKRIVYNNGSFDQLIGNIDEYILSR